MPRFPTKEADILALAKIMSSGYSAHMPDFPHGTGLAEFSWVIGVYQLFRDKQFGAKAALKLATQAKNEKLTALKRIIKSTLKKSEADVADDPEKLRLIGWGPKASPGQVSPPGQPTNLRPIAEGQASIRLQWDRPSGGQVKNYIIERRRQLSGTGELGPWQIAGTSFNNETNLIDQPRQIQLEYRAKAENTTGQSMPSNTVAVVL